MPSQQMQQPSQEALQHYDRAIELLNKIDKNENIVMKLDVASELALAIQTAGSPFARAHANLAMILNDLGKDRTAEWHANRALQINANEFRAQLVKIDLALTGVRVVKLRATDFVHGEGSNKANLGDAVTDMVFGSVFGTIGKTTGSLFAAASASSSQNKFKDETKRLITIFKNLCVSLSDQDEYLYMTDVLIGLGDLIFNEDSLKDTRNNLYQVAATVSAPNLNQTGREQEIQDLKRRAKGRFALTSD